MPKYEYACKSCGERLEVVQSFSDEPLTECPACGGVLRKVFSAPSITFKGSGFYRTDNRKRRTEPNAEPKTDKDKDKTSSDAKTPAASSESKAEPAKAETAPKAEPTPKAAEAKSA
jgi:putative FmdB family regulatory protein